MINKLKNIIRYVKYNEPSSYILIEIISIIVSFYTLISINRLSLKLIIVNGVALFIVIIVFALVFIKRLLYTKKNSSKYLKVTPAIFAKKAWINQRLSAIKGETAKGLEKDMFSIITKLMPGITYYAYTHELVKLNLDRLSKKGIVKDYKSEKAGMKNMKKKHVVNLKLVTIEQQFYYISFEFVGVKESK